MPPEQTASIRAIVSSTAAPRGLFAKSASDRGSSVGVGVLEEAARRLFPPRRDDLQRWLSRSRSSRNDAFGVLGPDPSGPRGA
jgi:hypothetical protein